MIRERHGLAVYRPTSLVTFRAPPPPPLWRRLLSTAGDVAFVILRPIAPALPIIGAIAGAMIGRAIT